MRRTFIDNARRTLAELRESVSMDISYAIACEDKTKAQATRDAILGHASGIIGAAVCKVRGHTFEDHSSIGPESGNECMHCTRCGYSFSHRYY